jgi:hypothetical protein
LTKKIISTTCWNKATQKAFLKPRQKFRKNFCKWILKWVNGYIDMEIAFIEFYPCSLQNRADTLRNLR